MNDLIAYRVRVEERMPTTLEVIHIRKFTPCTCAQGLRVTDYDLQGTANCTCEPTGCLSVL